jgi:hypothetical protein
LNLGTAGQEGWESWGGVTIGAPAAARIDRLFGPPVEGPHSDVLVFHRGTDNRLYVRNRSSGSGNYFEPGGTTPTFPGWEAMGGQLTSSPAAGSLTDRTGTFAGVTVGARHSDNQYRFRGFGVLSKGTEWTTDP